MCDCWLLRNCILYCSFALCVIRSCSNIWPWVGDADPGRWNHSRTDGYRGLYGYVHMHLMLVHAQLHTHYFNVHFPGDFPSHLFLTCASSLDRPKLLLDTIPIMPSSVPSCSLIYLHCHTVLDPISIKCVPHVQTISICYFHLLHMMSLISS